MYYTYLLLDPRSPGKYEYLGFCFLYKPYYVGKGKGHRAEIHFDPKDLERSRNSHKSNKIKKIISEGFNAKEFIVKINATSEDLALTLEKDFTHIIGLDNLTNMKHGGERGATGYKHRLEDKLKFSGENNPNFGKTWTVTEETKTKIGKASKKFHMLNDHPLLGVPRSEEQKEHHSKVMKEYFKNNKHPHQDKTYEDLYGKEHADRKRKKHSITMSGDNNPSKRADVREKLSKSLSGSNNPAAKFYYEIEYDNCVELVESLSVFAKEHDDCTLAGMNRAAKTGVLYKNKYLIIRKDLKN